MLFLNLVLKLIYFVIGIFLPTDLRCGIFIVYLKCGTWGVRGLKGKL